MFVAGGLLTVGEVASAIRVSNMTVYRLIKSGELPALRVGKNYRLRRLDVERFLDERSVLAKVGYVAISIGLDIGYTVARCGGLPRWVSPSIISGHRVPLAAVGVEAGESVAT